MITEEKYMTRCLEIAGLGLGRVAPNPMVGCVIVHNNKIIGEGFHQNYGEAHAEANAIKSVSGNGLSSLLPSATLFVNLEPCSHFGKTPPCADLLVKYNIPKVVIGCRDSNEKVSGKGIEKLKQSGCEVKVGVLENQSRILNKRFFTFYEKKRPYIILKWAQTLDGFISSPKNHEWISSETSKILVHKWRSEEPAIMVGTNTAANDNPRLNVRLWTGNNPLRIVIDKNLRLSNDLHLFDHSQPTLVFTGQPGPFIEKDQSNNPEYSTIDFNKDIIPQVLSELFHLGIQSILVEGGAQLLNSFFQSGLWDEARVFTGDKIFSEGTKAPELRGSLVSKEKIAEDNLRIFQNILSCQ